MPEDFLLDLDEANAVATALGGLDRLGELFVMQTRELIPVVLRLGEQCRHRWQQACRAVANGQAEQVHRFRDALLSSVETRLKSLQRTHHQASLAAVLAGAELERSGELPGAIAELQRLRDEIFARWQTIEDLQGLAVRDYPLSAGRLEALARIHAPPADWLTEDEERPF